MSMTQRVGLMAAFLVLGVAQAGWPCQPPPAGLVAWWPFDETAGRVAGDLSGNLNNASYSGHPPVPAAGTVEGALAFDGALSYVKAAPDPSLSLSGGRFTLGFWIHPAPTANEETLFIKGSPPDTDHPRSLNGQGFHLLHVESGRFVAVLRTGGTSFEADLSPAAKISAPPGVWTFVTVTVDLPAHTAALYVKGALARTVALPASLTTIANSEPLFIGGLDDPSPARSFQGLLDEVELFDRVLSPGEILALSTARAVDKCKEVCHFTRVVPCTYSGAGDAGMTICNFASRTRSYRWSLASRPAGAGFCNLDGPSSFKPDSEVRPVAAGDCVTVPVQIACPENPAGEGHGCFDLKVENPDTGVVLTCSGSYQFAQRWIWKSRQALLYTPPAASSPVPVIFDVTNSGPDGTLAFELNALPADGAQPGNGLVTLDGQQPGAAVRGAVTVPAGETRQVKVDASFLAHRPFAVYDVVVTADPDGGDVQVASAGLRSSPADCNGNGRPDRLDIGQGSNDCNGNGIPDECDLASRRETDCDHNFIPDSCDVAARRLADVNVNHVADICEMSSVSTRFSGKALGGIVNLTIQGSKFPCTVTVLTTKDETAAAVVASLAAAVNSSGFCLGSQGIKAAAEGDALVLTGPLLPQGAVSRSVMDPGLDTDPVIPTLSTLGMVLLAALLMLCGTVVLLRRAGAG